MYTGVSDKAGQKASGGKEELNRREEVMRRREEARGGNGWQGKVREGEQRRRGKAGRHEVRVTTVF